jgi:hypothetical protein
VSVVLAAVLLGVPRALEARWFGAQRPVYVDVAPEAPELTGLAHELERAIDRAACSLASRRSEATLVVELVGVSTTTGRDGRRMEAATFLLRDGTRRRPVVLHYPPGGRAGAARALVDVLSGPVAPRPAAGVARA